MHRGRHAAIVVLAILVGLALAATAVVISGREDMRSQQDALAPFYVDPVPMPPSPGVLVRSEPLTNADGTAVDVPGATAYRILYTSRRPSGEIAVSGGMAFVPDAPAPAGGRPVLAWAHGTVGQGDGCAPSRSVSPLKPIATWLPLAIDRGWAVIATDYTGLGTTGPNLYLVGRAEAADVVHSIQASRSLPSSSLSSRVVVMGHSQGGHAALWTGQLAGELDPSLTVLGVAAMAPAAELPSIMGAQWDTPVSWIIGPEVVSSWPVADPSLDMAVLSQAGERQSERLAQECIYMAALEGLTRSSLGQSYFSVDPLTQPSWAAFAKDQVPAPLPASVPVFLAQSLADTVVLAWPNAKLQDDWCAAGSVVDAEWLGEVSHLQTGLTAGPSAVQWAAARFAGDPAPTTCAVAPPIPPRAG